MSLSNKKSRPSSVINTLRPEDFPVGSPESRAAARAMLAARQSEETIIQITTMGMGFGPLQYILDKRGHIIRKIGRELTLEEAMAHPLFKAASLEGLTTEGRSSVLKSAPRQEQSVESDQPPIAPPAVGPEKATVDPLAAVHRRRFNG